MEKLAPTENVGKDIFPTDERVAELEKRFGKLQLIEVDGLEDEQGEALPTARIYFKRNVPNKIQVLTLANKKMRDNDIFGYAKIILGAFIVNGKELLNENEDFLIALTPHTDALATKATAILKK